MTSNFVQAKGQSTIERGQPIVNNNRGFYNKKWPDPMSKQIRRDAYQPFFLLQG